MHAAGAALHSQPCPTRLCAALHAAGAALPSAVMCRPASAATAVSSPSPLHPPAPCTHLDGILLLQGYMDLYLYTWIRRWKFEAVHILNLRFGF